MILIDFLQKNGISYHQDLELSQVTWLHRGGRADLYITPQNRAELVIVCKECYRTHIPFLLIGFTTNLFIQNISNIPVVISVTGLRSMEVEDNSYQVDCGFPVAQLAQRAIQDGCYGYEGLTSLPGAVGSALVNNAGCFHCLVSQNLLTAQVLLNSGELVMWTAQDFDWTERSSALKRKEKEGVIIWARFKRDCSLDSVKLQSQARHYVLVRQQTQEPPKQTLGSCFPAKTFNAFIHNQPLWLKVVYYYLPKRWGKWILLLRYKKMHLYPYISDRNMNCYIWKDERADILFKEYVQWFTQIAHCKEMEIEVI